MKSTRRGKPISAVEISKISDHDICILLDGRELKLPFDQFPWFKGATEKHVRNVRRPHAGHLRWPDLDVDLAVESLEHPERYPLISKMTGRRR